MVFQNYALYPHMNAYDEHGLRAQDARGRRSARSTRRVTEAARVLGLSDALQKKPRTLSGGQRQRVAMGRAIVREPAGVPDGRAALEPRREAARRDARGDRPHPARPRRDDDLRHARPDRGDDDGRPRRGDARTASSSRSPSPQELYDRPRNLFVAEFIGSPAMNLVTADLERSDGGVRCRVRLAPPAASTRRPSSGGPACRRYEGKTVVLGIRPEDIEDAALAGREPTGARALGRVRHPRGHGLRGGRALQRGRRSRRDAGGGGGACRGGCRGRGDPPRGGAGTRRRVWCSSRGSTARPRRASGSRSRCRWTWPSSTSSTPRPVPGSARATVRRVSAP